MSPFSGAVPPLCVSACSCFAPQHGPGQATRAAPYGIQRRPGKNGARHGAAWRGSARHGKAWLFENYSPEILGGSLEHSAAFPESKTQRRHSC